MADKILITGGAGYVGSHLTRKLLAHGHEVRVLDNFLYGDRGLADLRDNPRLEVRYGDVCVAEDVSAAASGCRAVIALAALVGDAACDFDPDRTLAVNFESTRTVLEACRTHDVERLVFASSCSVYGANGSAPLTETSPLHPVSLYARTRIMSEEFLAQEHGPVDIVVLRLATVCGLSPRMRFDLMVNTITARATVDRRVKIVGAQQWRPHVHVQDAAEAFMRAAEMEHRPGFTVMNVGANDQNFTIGEVAAKVLEFIPETEIEYVDGHDDPRSYRVRFDRIEEEIGFAPSFRIEDAIREVRALLCNGSAIDYTAPAYHNAIYLREKGTRPGSEAVPRCR